MDDAEPQPFPASDNHRGAKRAALEEPHTTPAAKRNKHLHKKSTGSDVTSPTATSLVPFPEKVCQVPLLAWNSGDLLTLVKPAATEERNGEIECRVVNNDGSRENTIVLTGLKCLFQTQLPKMPPGYIARLVFDRAHVSMALVKMPLEVVAGITFRFFQARKFVEIVFCAVSALEQVKGYGAHIMAHLKDYVRASSPVMHFLTYADNHAIGYFQKQGFTKEITLDRSVWRGYIKDYEGGTMMECCLLPKIRYLEVPRMLCKQKDAVLAKIRTLGESHIVHPPPQQWANGVTPLDPLSIPAIKATGWSPDMDRLSQEPRHGRYFNDFRWILNQIQNHRQAWPFLKPVNKDQAPLYYDIIASPMDLSTMEKRLEDDHYETPDQFVADFKLIFSNCRQYNDEATVYYKCAIQLEKYMWKLLKEVPEWCIFLEQE